MKEEKNENKAIELYKKTFLNFWRLWKINCKSLVKLISPASY